jgi:AcrR family transcriptional regulator
MGAGSGAVKKNEIVSLLMIEATGSRRETRHDGKSVPIQHRAHKTVGALLSAVETIVLTEGPTAATTTRTAAESGVAVGTIYRYFHDRDALLLAAYDASVLRVVESCAAQIDRLPPDLTMEAAASRLLALYLAIAEADPAHAALLGAMRAIRSIESDQTGNGEDAIMSVLIGPFLARFTWSEQLGETDLRLLRVLLGTLVDLYLMTPPGRDRTRLAKDIEAHMLLALRRAGTGS